MDSLCNVNGSPEYTRPPSVEPQPNTGVAKDLAAWAIECLDVGAAKIIVDKLHEVTKGDLVLNVDYLVGLNSVAADAVVDKLHERFAYDPDLRIRIFNTINETKKY